MTPAPALRILLVDDEPTVCEALSRMVRRLRPTYSVTTEMGGAEAIRRVDVEDFDVIMTDLQMPGVGGLDVLEHVQRRHPETARILVSGYGPADQQMRGAANAHRYLGKPLTISELAEALARVEELKRTVVDPVVSRAMTGARALPAAPPVFAALLEAMRDPRANMHTICDIVARDDAIAAKVLQVVNSALFGLGQPVESIDEAVSHIGLTTLRSLVLTVEAFRIFSPELCPGFSRTAHQQHAVLTARVAARIASGVCDPDSAFTAGLLHDVGKLVLASRLPQRLSPLLESARRTRRPLTEVERDTGAVCHGVVGGQLLSLWGLPAPICQAVAAHHDLARVRERWDLVAMVHVADVLAHRAAIAAGTEEPGARVELEADVLSVLPGAGSLARWHRFADEEIQRAMREGDLL